LQEGDGSLRLVDEGVELVEANTNKGSNVLLFGNRWDRNEEVFDVPAVQMWMKRAGLN
jgi:hypothetical protein